MKNFDAARLEGAPLNCYYCGREIPGGIWWARLKVGDQRVALCRPECVESFLADRQYSVGAGFKNGEPAGVGRLS